MTEQDWYAPASTLGLYLSGRDIRGATSAGAPVTDDSFLILLHSADRPASCVLPGPPWAGAYEVVVDTSEEEQAPRRAGPTGAAKR